MNGKYSTIYWIHSIRIYGIYSIRIFLIHSKYKEPWEPGVPASHGCRTESRNHE